MPERVTPLPSTLHASCVSIGGKGVLITGDPGSGKSDLCLRLIDAGAELVADDRVILTRSPADELFVHAPERLRGLLEVRGLGVMQLPYLSGIPLVLVVEAAEETERLPEQENREYLGISLPCIRLNLLQASASAKLRLALATLRAEQLAAQHMGDV